MNEKLPNNQEIPKAADAQVDIEIEIDPAMYIVGAKETPAAEADQGVMVGGNFIKPQTAGGSEHVPLPLGEEPLPVSDIYNRMVGGRGTDADEGIMVGGNFIKPATAGRQEHIPLPIGEEELPPNSNIYNRMVGGPSNERPDISI